MSSAVGTCALLLSLAACQSPPRGADSGDRPGPGSSGYGVIFLGNGDCSSRGGVTVVEVPCASERAVAEVLARFVREDGTRWAAGRSCPAATDFVLHISGVRRGGYACMRNLEPPHPGDPGQGGGPRTIVGDCVYGASRGEVRETACDGSGSRPPQFKVVAAVAKRAQCPAGTALYIHLGGGAPTGCARRLT